MERSSSWRRDLGLTALLLVATLAAYWPALHGALVWDDDAHITEAPLRSLAGLGRIWWDLGATQQYYPVLHSAFWIEHRLWGDAMVGYHLTNVLLHGLAACLVVSVMRRLVLPGAWLGGFLFSLHPVAVESVAWISEQKNTLSAVFYLCAGLAYLRFDRTRGPTSYWLAFGCYGLALLTKTVTATLPAALLVILWWQRGRLSWRREVCPLLPWLALGMAAGAFTAWVEWTFIGAHGAAFTLSLGQRILIAGRAFWFYLGKLVWPANLIFIYPRWSVDPAIAWQWLYPLGAVALVGILVWRGGARPPSFAKASEGRPGALGDPRAQQARPEVALHHATAPARRLYRGLLAGLLIFAGTLFPVLGAFNVYPFIFSFVADHFQYLARLGVLVPAAAAIAIGMENYAANQRVHTPSPRLRGAGRSRSILSENIPLILVVGIIAALGVITWRDAHDYRDGETLDRATLARNPSSWLSHYNLGVALDHRPGGLAAALAEYQATVKIEPGFADAHNNLGNALWRLNGDWDGALAEYRIAQRLRPDDAEVHSNLGNLLALVPARRAEALAEFRTAVRLDPTLAEAHFNLANELAKLPGGQAEAMAQYQAAVRIRPSYSGAYYNLGVLLAGMPGRLPEAISALKTAVSLEPDNARFRQSLGILLQRLPER